MTGHRLALPCVPPSALRGLPAPEDCPTAVSRRRYAFALACALAGEPSYEAETWPRRDCPPMLHQRAMEEDWPLIGTPATITILRPALLPDDPSALFGAAVGMVAAEHRPAVALLLTTLWAGAWPDAHVPGLPALLGGTIRRAAQAGYEIARTSALAA